MTRTASAPLVLLVGLATGCTSLLGNDFAVTDQSGGSAAATGGNGGAAVGGQGGSSTGGAPAGGSAGGGVGKGGAAGTDIGTSGSAGSGVGKGGSGGTGGTAAGTGASGGAGGASAGTSGAAGASAGSAGTSTAGSAGAGASGGSAGAGAGGASGAGAGGTSTSGSGGGGGVAGGPPCAEFAAAWCPRLGECAIHAMIRMFDDTATCQSVVTAKCNALYWDASFVDAGACVSSIGLASCDDVLDLVGFGDGPITTGVCALFPGDRAVGHECTHPFQCISGNCYFSGTPCGTCAQATLTSGMTCGVSGNACAPGLVCSQWNGTDFTCLAPPMKAAGTMCTINDECAHGLVCRDDLKVCAPFLPEGQTCSFSGPACDYRNDLTCDGMGLKCGTALQISKLGGSCSVSPPFPRCSDQAYCDPGTLKCVPRKVVGEDCIDDPVAGSSCVTDVACGKTSMKCEAQPACL